MDSREKIIKQMHELAAELSKNHPGSELADYVDETAKELEKSYAVAFTGTMQYFINKSPTIALSDHIEFTPKERALWTEVRSARLGNNLWAAFV